MDIKYRLQQYEDGTFGYYLIDGDEHCNYKTESKVICMQNENEDRDEFITKNGITFTPNRYGSNLKLDKLVNDEFYYNREAVTRQGYGLDKLVNDEDPDVRETVAEQGYGLDKLINDRDEYVREAVAKYLNEKADDEFIIDLGNKLLDKGYKLSTNNTKIIFTDETCTKFRSFHDYGANVLIFQVLIRLLWKNIRIKDIYDPNYPVIMKIYLGQIGKLKDE